jgi:HSP20 family protein
MARLVRWDPWSELAGLERQFDEMFGRAGRGRTRSGEGGWTPALDVHQDDDTIVIRAELAGIPPDQVDVTVEDNVLTLSGTREEDRSVEEGQWIRRERFTGRFQRSISLPPGVDADQIKATADNGVIEIRVPTSRSAEPQRIPLQTGGASGSGTQEVDVTSRDAPEQASTESKTAKSSSAGTKRSSGRRKSSARSSS